MQTAERVQKHRTALREAGLRPVQIWVYDTRKPNFTDECKKQCFIAAEADKSTAIGQFMDEALADIAQNADSWTE